MVSDSKPFGEAIARAHPETSKWARSHARMFPKAKPVIKPTFKLTAGASVFTIGSCFARNIEEHLKKRETQLIIFDEELTQ